MKVTKVCCQSCGADLQVNESLRFITCNYCHTRLEVVHDTTVTHTRLLDKIERTTDRMATNLKVIELQNDLERLDREWQSRRDSLMTRCKDGTLSEPSAAGSVFGGLVAVIFGIFWIGFATNMGAPSPFPLFGLLFIGFAIFNVVKGCANAGSYSNGREAYEAKRRRLIARLERERNGG